MLERQISTRSICKVSWDNFCSDLAICKVKLDSIDYCHHVCSAMGLQCDADNLHSNKYVGFIEADEI